MQPWFMATERFTFGDDDAWAKYTAWSGLLHLDEAVSPDLILCPTVLPDIKDEYRPYVVNEHFMLNSFADFPEGPPSAKKGPVKSELLGYLLADVDGGASALTNCDDLPDMFANNELSSKGVHTSHTRAVTLRQHNQANAQEERSALLTMNVERQRGVGL